MFTNSHQVYKCSIKGKFRSLGIKSTNPVAVGDYVFFEITDEKEQRGVIIKLTQKELLLGNLLICLNRAIY